MLRGRQRRALVLVHGSASDHRIWQAQRDGFGRQFRVHAYSRRCHWPNESIAAGADDSMAQQVDDLEALLESHVGEPAHLVGHSYGALPCPLLAEPPACAALRSGDTDAGVRTFGQAVFGKDGFERMPELQKEQVRANVSNIKAELLGSGVAPLDDAALRSLRTPVLLVRGQQSIALFQRLAERLEELLPRCERAAIPGARHAMQVDNPAAFNAAVLSFLARQRQAA